MPRQILLGLALIGLVLGLVQAQKKPANAEPAKPAIEKTAAEIEAERLLEERRASAQSLLISLALDARNFSDARTRARTQARIADMLWEADRERSRTLFRTAFDGAEVADAESQAQVQEDIRQQQARNGNRAYSYSSPPQLRREVLGMAGRRDPRLGEELLARYNDQKKPQSTRDPKRRADPTGSDEAKQRYDLAKELLSNGETQHALQFADPGLSSINIQSVDFLARLRPKDAVAADQRYAAMLQNAALNPSSDANTASLLASYIFSPSIYVTFLASGSSSTESGGPHDPANVSPELRAAFLRTAAAILLRPLPDQSAAGLDGQYLGLKRLLPLFERFAGPDVTASLKTELESLAAGASEYARNRDDIWMHRGIDPPEAEKRSPNPQSVNPQLTDREQTLAEQVDRARTSAERDRANLQLALLMIDKDERRARDCVDKIDDMDLRNRARAYVDASIAFKLVSKRDVEQALEFARNSELTHFQRSWLLSQTAGQIGVKDRERALPVIEDAMTEARRIETGDPDRPRALFAVANVVLRINHAAVWESVGDAIQAANSAEKFTGEDGEISFRLDVNGINTGHKHSFRDFDVADIFSKLAGENYDKALSLARGFQRGEPRANAVIAIAKSVLEEPKK